MSAIEFAASEHYVNQGTNIVKILPRNDFYVAELNIDYWTQD